ncbi:MAG: hypothetical protein IPP15_02720 [Saprospiraceae bacterium]|uniref:Uncharacterized protein n=1 Tax=Candidatus Opimibacter skivensis TaxID=2982028 RepID=A0A9D7SQQ8_9BACT|nr:hypothetical protein [Candidatus Opimibacter skivensis]
MDQDLGLLSKDELTQLEDAFAYITILIAGADGKIDEKEITWAEKIAHIRTFAGDERLKAFHEAVDQNLHSRIETLISELPKDVSSRSKMISEKLAQLNPVLSSLDSYIGAYLYKGFLTFAERVAKSSGGFLSFFTISPEERKWIGLPMLNAIFYDEGEEE